MKKYEGKMNEYQVPHISAHFFFSHYMGRGTWKISEFSLKGRGVYSQISDSIPGSPTFPQIWRHQRWRGRGRVYSQIQNLGLRRGKRHETCQEIWRTWRKRQRAKSRNFSKSHRHFPECDVKRGGGLRKLHLRVRFQGSEMTWNMSKMKKYVVLKTKSAKNRTLYFLLIFFIYPSYFFISLGDIEKAPNKLMKSQNVIRNLLVKERESLCSLNRTWNVNYGEGDGYQLPMRVIFLGFRN